METLVIEPIEKTIEVQSHPDNIVEVKTYRGFTDKEFADLMEAEGFFPQYQNSQNQ